MKVGAVQFHLHLFAAFMFIDLETVVPKRLGKDIGSPG